MTTTIKWVPQPHPSSVCGQACVAMLAGITLEDSLRIFGSKAATSTYKLRSVLRQIGFRTSDRLSRMGTYAVTDCHRIFKFTNPDKKHQSHWVLRTKDGLWLDPSYDPSWGQPPVLTLWKQGGCLQVWEGKAV